MKALFIILGIIAFFILILSVKVRIAVHSEDGVSLSIRWLFLKFNILPKKKKEKKPKKEKKKKEKKKKKSEEPEKKDEKIPEPKKKKDNIFVRYYKNNGVSGTVELLERLAKAIGGMFRRIGKAFIIEELFISLLVGAGDSAETAIKYGKTCSKIYPAMGLLVDNLRIRKYNLEVSPDFINGKNKARLHGNLSVRPSLLIWAVIVVAFQLLFKVVIKFLKGSKAKKAAATEENKNNK